MGLRLGVADGWQMPQGGIDPGETVEQAAVRELEEEIGTRRIRIVDRIDDWLYYDYPPLIARKFRQKGQKQKWIAAYFLGEDSEFSLSRSKPEFSDWRWGTVDRLLESIIEFKRPVYQTVFSRFSLWL